MAKLSDFAFKHSVATAGAIPATIVSSWYLETLSPAGIALMFVLFLAILNSLAALFSRRKNSTE